VLGNREGERYDLTDCHHATAGCGDQEDCAQVITSPQEIDCDVEASHCLHEVRAVYADCPDVIW